MLFVKAKGKQSSKGRGELGKTSEHPGFLREEQCMGTEGARDTERMEDRGRR